jgi:mannose-6-phosphate isomerase
MLAKRTELMEKARGILVSDESVRPWGSYFILDESEIHKVKRIEVLPGKRLSYQRHKFRAEHWMIIQGEGLLTLDGSSRKVHAGEAVDIEIGQLHRIENTSSELLIFVEVQTGTYFGEDDIERVEDDFGR